MISASDCVRRVGVVFRSNPPKNFFGISSWFDVALEKAAMVSWDAGAAGRRFRRESIARARYTRGGGEETNNAGSYNCSKKCPFRGLH